MGNTHSVNNGDGVATDLSSPQSLTHLGSRYCFPFASSPPSSVKSNHGDENNPSENNGGAVAHDHEDDKDDESFFSCKKDERSASRSPVVFFSPASPIPSPRRLGFRNSSNRQPDDTSESHMSRHHGTEDDPDEEMRTEEEGTIEHKSGEEEGRDGLVPRVLPHQSSPPHGGQHPSGNRATWGPSTPTGPFPFLASPPVSSRHNHDAIYGEDNEEEVVENRNSSELAVENESEAVFSRAATQAENNAVESPMSPTSVQKRSTVDSSSGNDSLPSEIHVTETSPDDQNSTDLGSPQSIQTEGSDDDSGATVERASSVQGTNWDQASVGSKNSTFADSYDEKDPRSLNSKDKSPAFGGTTRALVAVKSAMKKEIGPSNDANNINHELAPVQRPDVLFDESSTVLRSEKMALTHRDKGTSKTVKEQALKLERHFDSSDFVQREEDHVVEAAKKLGAHAKVNSAAATQQTSAKSTSIQPVPSKSSQNGKPEVILRRVNAEVTQNAKRPN
ncbi:expressed unknown protein (Partial), partial [Seminavis robusta]|eukprot:Sro2947_g340810.1 n/a (504) ;mRNA; f:8634-10147